MTPTVNQIPESTVPQGSAARVFPWPSLAWFGALVVACYLPVLIHLVWQWNNDEDMGHGFFVPLVAAYIIWQQKDQILSMPRSPSNRGLVILLWAALQLYLGTLGAELFLQRTAILLTIVGAIVLTCGWRVLKALAFPLFLLCFMVPIPRIIYTQITFPLQLFATQVAEAALNLMNTPVIREGNVLELANQKLSVVEACSGIRSLLSLTFLSMVYGYFFDSKPWMKWALLAATIPIAIIVNAGRVTVTGILSDIRPDLAQGFFHSLEGWMMFAVAFMLMICAHRLITFVYRRAQTRRTSAVS